MRKLPLGQLLFSFSTICYSALVAPFAALAEEPSPILLKNSASWRFDKECQYALVMWDRDATYPYRAYRVITPGSSVRLEILAGAVRGEGDLPTTCQRIIDEEVGYANTLSSPNAPSNEYHLDSDGDGMFETYEFGERADVTLRTPRLPRREAPYLITSWWIAPNGNKIVNQLAIYSGAPVAGVTINDGDEFTNDPDVTLTIAPRAGATSVGVSNDGGFRRGVEYYPLGQQVSWPLNRGVTGKLTKVVYVRYFNDEGDMGTSYSDDIVLDTTPPSLSNPSAKYSEGKGPVVLGDTLKTVKISAKASDKTSGVRKIQISSTKDSDKGVTVAFKNSVKVRTALNPQSLWVRVQDGAGNWSSWKQATGR